MMTLYDQCAAGDCFDYRCAMYGCLRRGHHMAIIPPVQGCICPPTSEQTCQNPTCPRKPRADSYITYSTSAKEKP